jgi:diguanylate cyclase (GGDEF)-like protein
MEASALAEGVRHAFSRYATDDEQLFLTIESLAHKQGDRAYHEALNYLFARNFSLDQASHYWREATSNLSRKTGQLNSFRAALLDYLRNKTNELVDPRIIESSTLEEIRRSAVSDGLTRLYNQSYFKQQLQQAVELANRQSGQFFSILLFDLDYFKQFNDRCGHLQGDEALRLLSQILQDHTDELDLPARYGGEEFAVLLPDSNLEEAIQRAEAIRRAVEQQYFAGQEKLDAANLTISGGVACYPQHGTTANALIEAADRMLYEAKVTRNMVLPRLDDTRSSSRHQYRNIVELRLAGQPRFSSALSADISRCGLSLKSDRSPKLGSVVELRFRYPFWPRNLETFGYVRHISGTPAAGSFKIGIEFDQPQDDFCATLLPASFSSET